jgi:hypothetical protein
MRQMRRGNHDPWLSLHFRAMVNLAEPVRVLPVGKTGWRQVLLGVWRIVCFQRTD